MKAIVLNAFGGTENFTQVDVPIPEVREGDVRIRVRAVSFNPVDCQIRRGQSEARRLSSMILGRDLSGTIDEVGAGVSEFRTGDEVYSYVNELASSGTYAEYVSVPAEIVAHKPRSLAHAQAAAVPVVGVTASLALSKVHPGKGQSVFVAGGAGGVGSTLIALARSLGLENVVTTAGNARSRAYLIEYCGLRGDQIEDYNKAHFVERVRERHPSGYDITLDLVGGRMLSACCELLAIEGDLVSITQAPDVADAEHLFVKNASFHAIGANAYSLTADRAVWRRYQELLNHLAWQYDNGLIAPPKTRILGSLGVHVVQRAHDLLDHGGVQGKLVMLC